MAARLLLTSLRCSSQASAVAIVSSLESALSKGEKTLLHLDQSDKRIRDLQSVYGSTLACVAGLRGGTLLSRYGEGDKSRLRGLVNDIKLRHSLTSVEALFDYVSSRGEGDDPEGIVESILKNHFDIVLMADHFYELANPKVKKREGIDLGRSWGAAECVNCAGDITQVSVVA